MAEYELKKSVSQLKTRPKPQSFALYSGDGGDQILITPKRAGPREVAMIAADVGSNAERRCQGVCSFHNEQLTFKTKSKWNATLETSIVKVLKREGLSKFVPPAFVLASEGEALDEEDAPPAKGKRPGETGARQPVDPDRAAGERIERLSGGNPKLSKMAEGLLAEVRKLKAEGREAEAAEKEAYLGKVVNALVRTPEAMPVAKVDPSAVEAATAAAAPMPHPRGQGGAVDYPSEEDFFDAYGQFRDQFRAWVHLVEKGQPQLFDLQAEVDSARAAYTDRRTKGEQSLRQAMKSEFPAKLKALNARQPRVNTLVLDTTSIPTLENSTSRQVEAARAKVSGALKAVAAAALEIHMLELRDTIDDLESRRKALQATIDRNVGIAEKFITAALSGPLAVKGLLESTAKSAALDLASQVLAGVFSQKEQAELEKVNRQLDEKKRELKKSERDRLQALLDKARADLEAETHTLYSKVDEAYLVRKRGDDNFAEVATLASNGGLTVFAELKKYRAEMQRLWQRYTDAASYLIVLLRSAPLADAYKVANARIATIKQAKAEFQKSGGEKTDEQNLILMDMSAHYKRYADWYYGEIQKYKAVGEQLGKGEHTALIGEVLEAAKAAMNG